MATNIVLPFFILDPELKNGDTILVVLLIFNVTWTLSLYFQVQVDMIVVQIKLRTDSGDIYIAVLWLRFKINLKSCC